MMGNNSIRTREDWENARTRAADDPGGFHGDIAKRELHWYVPQEEGWITWSDDADAWRGFDRKGERIEPDYPKSFEPWDIAFDDSNAPLYTWFSGGRTNACFNEVDRHVLSGHGEEIAFHFEGDRWDQSRGDGRGEPVVSKPITRRELLVNVVIAAQALKNLGLEKGDRIALNMPNVMEQIYYTEAAKRLGIVYTPVFGGFSDKTLSDRIAKVGADVLITTDGGYRNAEVVPYKEQYADPALDNYLPVDRVQETIENTLNALNVRADLKEIVLTHVSDAIEEEITVERADAMRGVGHALSTETQLDSERISEIRTEIAHELVDVEKRLEHVIVVEHTGQEIQTRDRDVWSADLISQAQEDVLNAAREVEFDVTTMEDLYALSDRDLVRACHAANAPEPVDAEYPLFVIFTSGSTGKPKGVVHVHGGYTAGIAHTMKISFDVVPGEDTIFVVADPGWITGQSYLISAALSTRTTSIIAEGSPLYPNAGRFTSIIERYDATAFKAGVTFLKTVMEDEENISDMREWSTDSLRVATFCAEPVNPAVQEFGMEEVCERYINSYWATEHGGIVWTHLFGNKDFPLEPDAHTYPLPWVFGDVWTKKETTNGVEFEEAGYEKRGEIMITEPYPYLMRYVWGDLENWNPEHWTEEWSGNDERFIDTYWIEKDGEWAYLQGDVAQKYEDDSFSLHGRSDEVINVSGHRMGTEELEAAILKDKQLNPDSPVANAVVVGAAHPEKGLTPVAFIQTQSDEEFTTEIERRLTRHIREEKGAIAIPEDFIEIEQFPETRSGKYMRRMLGALLEGDDIGDTTTLKNPEAIEAIRPKAERWQRRQRLQREQEILDQYRFFTVQYNDVREADTMLATVIVDNPPVNALTERALDELNTIVDHLDRREEVGAVVVTGEGNAFVAGADIEQFLEEVHNKETARTLSKKAHEAFDKLEELSKPVVTAINGVALGGGNEFQLATHYTVADEHAEFGQPELKLNLIPGYGGTQRLPRILLNKCGYEGLQDAITLITNGRPITAEEALEMGVVDEVATEKTARTRAAKLAREYIRTGEGPLADVHSERRDAVVSWRESGTFDTSILESDDVRRNRRQCENTSDGRTNAFERAVEAIRTGFEAGIDAGYETEADGFAEAVIDPADGKTGIEKFLNGRPEPLPIRPRDVPDSEEAERLLESGDLLPVGAPFYPGVDDIPAYQFGWAAVKDADTGTPAHGDPENAEVEGIYAVEEPGPNEVLLYVLASEVNFNDIWAITGIPVSQFENHDQDYHITGSGGVALVVEMGEAVRTEGRVGVGDLVATYSGQSELLSPRMGLDPMYAGFSIQGYEEPNGSHQQFMLAQGPQVHPIPVDATLEEAGSYMLALGTVYRALFTTLEIEPDTTMFVEGASTGTGWESARTATRNGVAVTGLCSTDERAKRIESLGSSVYAINRKADSFSDIWGPIPADSDAWQEWKEAGRPFVRNFRDHHDGRGAEYVVSHAGEQSFPRSFQLLNEGGKLTFWGASTGYHLTFLGKSGTSTPDEMFDRVDLRANDGVLVYYGTDTCPEDIVDETGLLAIEAARNRDARIVVVTYTDEQREFVESLGYGDAVVGSVSIEGLERRDDDFEWPYTMPALPHPQQEPEAFKRTVQEYTDTAFKPIGKEIGQYLRNRNNPRGNPDVVFERAHHDTLGVSTMLVRPHTGCVVYSENLNDKRYSFYAPQVWMRQRTVHMPTAEILGTHLSNAYEVEQMNAAIDSGSLELTEPELVDWDDLPSVHQLMWDNEHDTETYVANHALPLQGLHSKTELYQAWGQTDVDEMVEARNRSETNE
jgi:acrylyl-CoA reductase (NADPH) / 3-hydroxypropionyl-CoA dehydratase / 3-hydroxypropionyl-CoA synthetase